jgi:hypothetical protein
MPFNTQDKNILEHLTGKVPILLNAIVSVPPKQLSEVSDGGEFKTTDGDEYKRKSQRFYHLLYKTTEVKDLVGRISVYAKRQSIILRDTDEFLQ